MADQRTTPSPAITSPEDAAAQVTVKPTAGVTAPEAHPGAARPWFKKKHIVLPSAVVLLFAVIMVSTGGNDPRIFDFTTNVFQAKAESATLVSPATATIGQSVRDSKLAFIVASMQSPGKTLTDRFGATSTAQGVFVIVRVNVTDIGPQARALKATDQFLVDSLGQRYATSPAISSLKGAETVFRTKLNPGQSVNDIPLLFDVPAGTTIASIELHDSPTSTGVRVKL